MKLDQLQYFVETAKRQHIGQAARYLNISPSAISHSISSLEEEFGQMLFEKQGRQIKLTHHGKLLLDRAEFLLNEVGRIKDELSSNDELDLRGHYRIAATHILCSSFITPAWMNIQKNHPFLTSTLLSLKSADVLSVINSGEADLGICFSPHIGPNIDHEIIHEGKLLISMGKNHPFLKNQKIEELNKWPMLAALGAHGIDNCESHPSFKKFNISSKIINLYDNYDVALAGLKFNNAWTLLPDFIVNQHKKDIHSFTPKGWDSPYRIAVIWPKYRIRTTALDQVVERTKSMIQALLEIKK